MDLILPALWSLRGQHPAHETRCFAVGKTDISPPISGRCKTPIGEIQAAIDGAVSPEQAVKLRQCLDHIDELEMHIEKVQQEILRLSDKYQAALDLVRTVQR